MGRMLVNGLGALALITPSLLVKAGALTKGGKVSRSGCLPTSEIPTSLVASSLMIFIEPVTQHY